MISRIVGTLVTAVLVLLGAYTMMKLLTDPPFKEYFIKSIPWEELPSYEIIDTVYQIKGLNLDTLK